MKKSLINILIRNYMNMYVLITEDLIAEISNKLTREFLVTFYTHTHTELYNLKGEIIRT